MIFVKRPAASTAVAAALSKRGVKSGLTELEAALWYYEKTPPSGLNPLPARPVQSPKFAVYSEDAVKEALNTLFKGHCAYCESRYEHVAPMDVEHYRPKSGIIGVAGKLTKPGYYWLAADWHNLLPSCIGCNRAREQLQKLADGSVVYATTGKANLFPVLAGTVHAKKSGGEAAESPLLLDPCRDDPAPHLLFRWDGWIEARASPQEAAAPRGFATIETCGLYRASLVEVRRKAGVRLRDAMEGVLSADSDCRNHPGDPAYKARLARRQAALDALVGDTDYRALTAELMAIFGQVRTAIDAYFIAQAAWTAQATEATRSTLIQAVRNLRTGHAQAGKHQSFVTELYGLADIPIEKL